jgi:hypothetical protein
VAIALVAGVLAPVLGAATPAGAAVAAVASSSNGSSGSRSFVTLNRPAGTVAGQVMVAQLVSNDDDPGFTAPAGWTLVSDRSITNALRQAVYLKVAGSSESTLYTWKLSTSTFRRIAGGITTYSGVDLTTPIEAAGTSVNSTASTTVTAPSITTTVPGALLVHLAAINAEGTLSPPAGMTERWEATSPSSADSRDALASASDTTQAAAGATGATAATASLPGPSIGTVVALRPAGPPPPPPPPDTDPPTTTITGGPTGTVTTSSASFTFTSGDPTATFECSLDGASFAACSSPRDYTGLSNGPHTFAVRAVDPSNNVDATPDTRTWTVNAPPPTDAVLVGAGDIAGCGQTGDTATANLLAGIAGTVFTAGDNVYNDGSATQFTNCYQPTWGQFKSRTLPTPGNHDYMTPNAAGYFGYFGAAAGPSGRGYYDTTVGAWHVISLNSNCSFVGGCGAGSPQEQWLRGVLQASSAPCTVAIMHHAWFNSGANHGSDPEVQPLWQALYDNGADVVVNGHEHVYERFGPQTPSGQADAVFGLRQFTVGTGGYGHY